MRSRPLEIVYNAKAIERIQAFFADGSGSSSGAPAAPARGDIKRGTASFTKYQRLKRNTQVEFQEALGKFLQSDLQVENKRIF